jgi:hypothetical protein
LDSKNAMTQALVAVLQGDPAAMDVLLSSEHKDLQAAATAVGQPALVTSSAAVRVLRGLLDNSWTPAQAQAWASFVRRGYVASRSVHPLRPLAINFDDAAEEEIAEVVSRLDEIGDLVDGDLTNGEIVDLLHLLGEA